MKSIRILVGEPVEAEEAEAAEVQAWQRLPESARADDMRALVAVLEVTARAGLLLQRVRLAELAEAAGLSLWAMRAELRWLHERDVILRVPGRGRQTTLVGVAPAGCYWLDDCEDCDEPRELGEPLVIDLLAALRERRGEAS